MTDHDPDDRDPLRGAGSRLRGAVDPGAFDPDWDGRARARRRRQATVVASVAATLAIVVGGVAVATTGGDDGGNGGQVVATAPDTVPDTEPRSTVSTDVAAPTSTSPAGSASTSEPAPVTTTAPATPAVVVSRDGLLGWWDGSAWQDVDARSPEVPVEPGTDFAVVGIGRESRTAVSGAVAPFCEPLQTYWVPLDPPLEDSWREPGQIAVNATWDVVPRAAEQLDPTGQTYLDATEAIAADLGVGGSPAHLDQVVRADLDGDGTDEVVLVGRHPDADPGGAPRAGWYAFVALRTVVDGEVRTDVLDEAVFEQDDETYPNMTTFQLDAVADLNGDGRMEVVYGASQFEGAGTFVVEWTGPGDEPEQVLQAGCGV